MESRAHAITRRFAEMSVALARLSAGGDYKQLDASLAALKNEGVIALKWAWICSNYFSFLCLHLTTFFALSLSLFLVLALVEAYIMRQAAEFPELRDQLSFLINNYDLLQTIWGDHPPPDTEHIDRRVKV